ncbi:uncharacterized protein EI97DRAFT_59149 [Westerdykella ornata]|uniref:Uncharacterized protein n=1 Tax=Westerdykella ornata TaxID=318751 RepID=A0A6A6JGU9_WESOR|nr:uncharacterized protein EI97DRAFT_59149 [Westerdykella ornata]KAF2275880.1 hypothetical protein EI97DRAFT_59149 [Westerdykella ornata]
MFRPERQPSWFTVIPAVAQILADVAQQIFLSTTTPASIFVQRPVTSGGVPSFDYMVRLPSTFVSRLDAPTHLSLRIIFLITSHTCL